MAEKNGAKFAFYYLLSLAALVFMSIAVGLIAFGIINETISDPLLNNYYNSFNSQFKFAISALIISTPIYFLTISLINKGVKKEEIKLDSPIRRWLTYFILFVSSLIILGFLIGIINSFLSGELTLRFILKALTVFLISGLVFAYYFNDIRREKPEDGRKLNKVYLASSLIIVLAAFISVWFFIESPATARGRKLDQRTLNDISNLESSVNYYYSQNGELPEEIEEVAKEEKNVEYFESRGIEYKKTGDMSFELCATFRTNSEELNDDLSYIRSPRERSYEEGYNCLEGNLWDKPNRIIEEEINID